jgi:DNA-binding transcriptional MerR regulator
MPSRYRAKAFAAATGVSVKTLHHYDRLGLLTPARTGGGYREYSGADFERLELIASLKFLGLRLREIATVLQGRPNAMIEALRRQRAALDDRIANLDAARRAIDQYVGASGPPENEHLKRLVDTVRREADLESMKKYYDEAGWQRHRRFYEEGPSDEWRELYADIVAFVDHSDHRDRSHRMCYDPGSAEAQILADRWLKLSMRAYSGDVEVQTDSPVAWMNRAHWPAGLKRRAARLRLEEVHAFVNEAARCASRKYFSKTAWTRLERQRERTPEETSRLWQARVDLFRDLEAARTKQPAPDEERAFVDRWMSQVDQASGGDPDIKAGLLETWADRARWSPVLRWRYEAFAMMTGERFDRAADHLDRVMKERTTTTRRHDEN